MNYGHKNKIKKGTFRSFGLRCDGHANQVHVNKSYTENCHWLDLNSGCRGQFEMPNLRAMIDPDVKNT